MAIDKAVLNNQNQHWETVFLDESDMFGIEPSQPALFTAELCRKERKGKILELGAGQGRDTVYLASQGLSVWAIEYTATGAAAIKQKALKLGLSDNITVIQHDVRKPLPFEEKSFDACFSHMLYCMAFTGKELELLSSEVRRTLRPGGLNIYTARNTADKHYGTGIHRGENMYEVNGFIVHFFDRQLIDRLASGYGIQDIAEFEEGELPRTLYRVTLQRNHS